MCCEAIPDRVKISKSRPLERPPVASGMASPVSITWRTYSFGGFSSLRTSCMVARCLVSGTPNVARNRSRRLKLDDERAIILPIGLTVTRMPLFTFLEGAPSMKRKMHLPLLFAFVIVFLRITALPATETENLGIRALPAPGKVVVDGKTDDWDLSAGMFTCGDVENRRDTMAAWIHVMYDADNLYVLTRWNDETPLNNPGQTLADYGFRGDCLQFRVITHPDDANERTSHWTCWRGQDGDDVMFVDYGKQLNEGYLKNAKTQGAQQALLINSGAADSTGTPQPKGYVQEIAVPWSLLLKEGQRAPKAGERFVLAIELNFTVGQNGRGTLKDNFKPGVPPNRVMTFSNSQCWGYATLECSGHVEPSPVRLADAREFPVKLQQGHPVVDWTGLIKSKAPKGFKAISFTMPEDGYISLNIKDQSKQPVCQLLNAAFFTKGTHDVLWDGLTTMNFHTPGQPLPAGRVFLGRPLAQRYRFAAGRLGLQRR